jgi:Cullin family
MYKLFSRVPEGLNEMRTYIRNYVLELGNLINAKVDSANDNTKPKDKDGVGASDKSASTTGSLYTALRWVQDILELQEKFNKIIDFAVLKDKSFQTAVNEVNQCQHHYCLQILVLTILLHRHLKRSSMQILGLLSTYLCLLMKI